jgi:hypothetical protein
MDGYGAYGDGLPSGIPLQSPSLARNPSLQHNPVMLHNPSMRLGDEGGMVMQGRPAPTSNQMIFDRWFQFADRDSDGRVTGKDAVGFFEKSELPRDVLFKAGRDLLPRSTSSLRCAPRAWLSLPALHAQRSPCSSMRHTVCPPFSNHSPTPPSFALQVWEMANSTKAGYLDKAAFHKAMDIISLAQMVGTRSVPACPWFPVLLPLPITHTQTHVCAAAAGL